MSFSEFLEALFQMENAIVCVRRRENGTREIKGGICLPSVQFPVPVCAKKLSCSMIMKRIVIFLVNSMFSLNVPEC